MLGPTVAKRLPVEADRDVVEQALALGDVEQVSAKRGRVFYLVSGSVRVSDVTVVVMRHYLGQLVVAVDGGRRYVSLGSTDRKAA